jgi:hypothetical protein
MAARRRPGGRIALALAASLAVHAAVLLTGLAERQPMRGQAGASTSLPVLIDLQRGAAAPDHAHPAAAQASGRRALETGEAAPSSPMPTPGPPAPGTTTTPGAATGPADASDGDPGSPGRVAGQTLTFDCPPGGELTRTGAVRANPCAFRGAPRDHLPEQVARQSRIDPGKAAYYDRVLEANARMRNDPSYGNLPFFTCRIQFGGGKGAPSAHPPHTYKFGRLPCYLIPPHGNLDPDVFVEPPPPKNPLKPGEMKE